jgi:hypothetical protein
MARSLMVFFMATRLSIFHIHSLFGKKILVELEINVVGKKKVEKLENVPSLILFGTF